MACFPECGCNCFDHSAAREFDRVLSSEMVQPPTLAQITSNHLGWFQDGEEGSINRDIEWLELDGLSGVYILWRATGYCVMHDTEHLTAEYVGKAGGSISSRLFRHQRTKALNDGMMVEVSAWQCSNRQAKFFEQALLDYFFFPFNRSEMRGSRRLCLHIAPGEWS